MTQEEIKTFDNLYSIFEKDCWRVVNVLKGFHVYTYYWSEDIREAERFEIAGDTVNWEGEDRDHDRISGSFPAKYLSMSDDDIHREAQKTNDEFIAKLQRDKEEREAKEREEKYKQYLALKKQFEG